MADANPRVLYSRSTFPKKRPVSLLCGALGPGHEHREVDPSAAPGRLEDAAGLPPAYIEVGQLDIFRDEAIRSTAPATSPSSPSKRCPPRAGAA